MNLIDIYSSQRVANDPVLIFTIKLENLWVDDLVLSCVVQYRFNWAWTEKKEKIKSSMKGLIFEAKYG